jgi:hypothetical protein
VDFRTGEMANQVNVTVNGGTPTALTVGTDGRWKGNITLPTLPAQVTVSSTFGGSATVTIPASAPTQEFAPAQALVRERMFVSPKRPVPPLRNTGVVPVEQRNRTLDLMRQPRGSEQSAEVPQ